MTTDNARTSGDLTDGAQHAAYWLGVAEAEVPHLLSGGRPAALGRFERDNGAYRRALRWLIDTGDADGAARLVRALRTFWGDPRRRKEGQAWIAQVLALPQAGAGRSHRHPLHEPGLGIGAKKWCYACALPRD